MTSYRVKCNRFVVQVDVVNTIISDAPPIVRRFIGQPFTRFIRWCGKLGGLRYQLIQ
jgi:hypothetical protein